MRVIGEVTLSKLDRGYFFVRPLGDHQPEVFLHITNIEGRIKLEVGDLVSFEIGESERKPGKLCATNARFIKRDDAPGPTEVSPLVASEPLAEGGAQ